MRFRFGLLLLLFAGLAAAYSQTAPPLAPAQFAQEMARLRGEVARLESTPESGPALAASLPRSWTVWDAHGELEVSADFLRDGIQSFLKAPPKEKPQRRQELENSLRVLEEQAAAYDAAAPVAPELHQRLEKILQAREFRGLHGPSPMQLLWQRILSWLQKRLEKLLPNIPSASDAGPVFAWCIIALVCSMLGVWLYRRSRENELQLAREVIPFAPGAKGWRSWLAEARARAAEGAWRDAIHLAFWASVAKLESDGTWLPDRARTPREYLRAIPEWNAARPAFQLVMRSLERCWYGGLPATAEDFQQVQAALERMGCR
jgi:hypothetical protein